MRQPTFFRDEILNLGEHRSANRLIAVHFPRRAEDPQVWGVGILYYCVQETQAEGYNTQNDQ